MAEEWTEIICDEEDIPPAMNADEQIAYWQEKLSEHDDAVIRTNELLAEERQLTAGLRTKVADHAKTIDSLSDANRMWRHGAAWLCVFLFFLVIAVALLIGQNFN